MAYLSVLGNVVIVKKERKTPSKTRKKKASPVKTTFSKIAVPQNTPSQTAQSKVAFPKTKVKQRPAWLIGGLIGDATLIPLVIIYVIYAIVYVAPNPEYALTHPSLLSVLLALPFYPMILPVNLGLVSISTENVNTVIILGVASLLISYFIIGAVAGVVIKKLKSRKK
ncbi:Uncharacterised protein [uncultured archaeon]|nr:Uncharacterised protein [uncultured archaeon]